MNIIFEEIFLYYDGIQTFGAFSESTDQLYYGLSIGNIPESLYVVIEVTPEEYKNIRESKLDYTRRVFLSKKRYLLTEYISIPLSRGAKIPIDGDLILNPVPKEYLPGE